MKRKLFRKTAYLLTRVILTAGLCTACGSSTGNTGGKAEGGAGKPEPYTLPDNEIIFLNHYTNGAWGRHCSGSYIRSDGRVYSYDFSTQGYDYSRGMDLMDRLALWEKHFEPVGQVDREFLEELYDYGMRIDPDAEMDLDPETACDAGEDELIFRNPETGTEIICYEWGDTTGTLDDPYAHKLVKLWKSESKEAIKTVGDANTERYRLFTQNDIPVTTLNHYVDIPAGDNGFYVVKSTDALRKNAEKLWGLKADDLLKEFEQKVNEGVDPGSYSYYNVCDENCVYFLRFQNFSTMGHIRDTDGFCLKEGVYGFLPSDADHDPGPDETVAEAMDGYIYIAAVPVYELPDDFHFTDPDGNEWKVVE